MSKTRKTPPKQWTVLVYMASDNTLAAESIWALTEINRVQFNPAVQVVALLDSAPPEVETKRYVFGPKQPPLPTSQQKTVLQTQPCRSSLLEEGAETFNRIPMHNGVGTTVGGLSTNGKSGKTKTVNTASDYRLLQFFIEDTLSMPLHQAEKYMLVLSGHGSGAIGDFLTSERPKGSLSITDLQKVLTHIKEQTLKRKLDILGMDSCLMSMVEVGYEVRDAVHLLVGAEGFEPETGWPYWPILDKLNATPKMDATDLANLIVNEHIAYYKDFVAAGLSVDLAACDLTQMGKLAEAIKQLAIAMKKQLSTPQVQDAIILAHWRAQSYHSEQYTDLWDFCEILQNYQVGEISEKCQEVQKSMRHVVRHYDYYGPAYQYSHGLSIYFPWKDSNALRQYRKLSFAKDTEWGDFLLAYVRQTQRPRRGATRVKAKDVLDNSHEEVNISSLESPIVIPVATDFPDNVRVPPDGLRVPPDGPRGTVRAGNMKNPPRYFLRDKITKSSVK